MDQVSSSRKQGASAHRVVRPAGSWRSEFHQAAIEGHVTVLKSMLEQIQEEHAELSQALEQLLARYQMDRLAELFED